MFISCAMGSFLDFQFFAQIISQIYGEKVWLCCLTDIHKYRTLHADSLKDIENGATTHT